MGKWVRYEEVANTEWYVWQEDNGKYQTESVTRAILLDIRAELRRLNTLLHCPNFTAIPHTLLAVKKNTTRRRRKGK